MRSLGEITWGKFSPQLIVGVILLPILLLAGVMVVISDANGRDTGAPAAIVNLDEPVTIDDQIVPLGRQLSAELVKNTDSRYHWVLTDQVDATAGLANGSYSAAVIIPKDFSANATSYKDIETAKQAVIEVQTSPVAGLIDSGLGRVIARAAADALNNSLTSAYLDRIYLGFNTQGAQMVELASGANQLALGSRELADGAVSAADGSQQLADGLGQLSAATGQLTDGADQLASGAGQLSSGVGQYTRGVSKIASGAQQGADAAQVLANKTDQYVAGVNQLVEPISNVMSELQGIQVPEDLKNADWARLSKNLRDAADWLDQVQAQSGRVNADLDKAFDDTRTVLKRIEVFANQLEKLDEIGPSDCPSDLTEAECSAWLAGHAFAVAQVNRGDIVKQLRNFSTQALRSLEALRSRLDEARVDAKKLPTQLRQASGIAVKIGGFLPQIDRLSDPRTSDRLRQLTDAGPKLAGGWHRVADGTSALAGGLRQVDGPNGSNSKQLASGASELNSGLRAFRGGLTQYADGVGKASVGANELASGLGELSDGATKLADGTAVMADGIADGVDKLPNFPDGEREKLADVVSSPVNTADLDGVSIPELAWFSLLVVAGLWLGAMAMVMSQGGVHRELLLSHLPSWRVALSSALPLLTVVAIESFLVTFLASVFLHPGLGTLFGILGFSLLAGFAFVAVNSAAIGWFGDWGRLLMPLLLLITFLSALSGATPSALESVRAVSPASPALDGLRALWLDNGQLWPNVVALVLWLTLGAVASLAAVTNARRLDSGLLAG